MFIKILKTRTLMQIVDFNQCRNMLYLRKPQSWLKKIKLFLFFKSALRYKVKLFPVCEQRLSHFSYFNVFILKKNENLILKSQYPTFFKKLSFIGIGSSKNFLKKKNIFRVVYTLYKTFFKNGFLLKVIKSLNKCLKSLNQKFYDSCLFNYFSNNYIFINELDSSHSVGVSCTEVYSFKNLFYRFEDLALLSVNMVNQPENFNVISFNEGQTLFDDNYDDNINQDISQQGALSSFVKSKNKYSLNVFFKYFFFFKISNIRALSKNFKFSDLVSSYMSDVCCKSYKLLSVSFFLKYFFVLFYNVGKKVRLEYSKILNNFLSILFFIPKLLKLITFFFKVQAVSLSKRVRKSLKNKYRHAIVYKYIKPNRRLKTSVSFLKSFLLLVDGQGLDKKVSNVLSSIMIEKNDSLIVRLKNIQQFECFKHIKFEKD